MRSVLFGVVLLFFVALYDQCAHAYPVTLKWDANPATDNVSLYRVYQKTGSADWARIAEVAGDLTEQRLTHLEQGILYTFYVSALSAAGLESEPSEKVSYIQRPAGEKRFFIRFPAAQGAKYEIDQSVDLTTWRLMLSVGPVVEQARELAVSVDGSSAYEFFRIRRVE